MHIRFFHALFALQEKINVSVEGGTRFELLSFGELSEYRPGSSGFLNVTVAGSRTKNIYLQKTLPFFSPDAFTLAIIPGSMGIDLLQIPDYACFPTLPGFGCIRTVNLTDEPPAYHLYLYGKRLLFPDVSFRHITCHKQIREGSQGVYLTLPGGQTPLIPSVFPIRSGEAATLYVYGSLPGETLSLLKTKDTPDGLQASG
ncbi:MAG: DUF4397 domain-containing protein [Lachnospiraceae bacterium]|nr:DUF4397 domain-containing protein [Lachnospiraceae bacterium]